ncbi:MAG: leucine-rich repeat protein [Kiritimatiellae bacterium]|nr:leucine-rich repeat protein [Kiritimatiellia bacterium]
MKKILSIMLMLLTAAFSFGAWRYVEDPGKWNGAGDKAYTGYITDDTTWTIYVLQQSDGTWQLGAGTFGVDLGSGGGSCNAGRPSGSLESNQKTDTGVGSGVLDLCEAFDDLPDMQFTAIGPRCFYNHKQITGIVIPAEIKELKSSAFNGSSLTSITFEAGSQLTTIQDSVFRSAQSIKILNLKDTKLESIGSGCFDAAIGFREISLPSTLTTLSSSAFSYITDSDMVYHFAGAIPTSIGSSAFRPRSLSEKIKWAFFVDVNTKGTWPIRTDVAFADATLPMVDGVTFAEEDYLGYLYLSDLPGNNIDSPQKVWIFKEGVLSAIVPPSISAITQTGRNDVSIDLTLDMGTADVASMEVTLNDTTITKEGTEAGTYEFDFEELSLETTYSWVAILKNANGDTVQQIVGSATTLPPDVSIGKTSFTQPKDGLSATVIVEIATLISESAEIVFSFNGEESGRKTVTATGEYGFDVSGLKLNEIYNYSFTVTSSEYSDVATAEGSFEADYYHWVFTPVPNGYFNGCPFSGYISDRNWNIRIYCPDSEKPDEFYLGTGGVGTIAAVGDEGKGILDLTTVYEDTLKAGTPVKLVKVTPYSFPQNQKMEGIIFPKTLKHISFYTFYGCRSVKFVDLSQTQVTNIEARAFQDNYGCSEYRLPKTLETIGACAFAWGPAKRVFYFYGDVPAVSLTTSSTGTGNVGGDQSIYPGANNYQWAYVVDSRAYPRWKTDASTTLYTEANPFPDEEISWIPEAVRYGVADGYAKPFGNSTLGRGYDTSAKGRAYLIHETLLPIGTMIFVK